MAALNRWSEWLPRMIYVGVLVYAGWQIVQWYSAYLDQCKEFDRLGNRDIYVTYAGVGSMRYNRVNMSHIMDLVMYICFIITNMLYVK